MYELTRSGQQLAKPLCVGTRTFQNDVTQTEVLGNLCIRNVCSLQ